MSAIPREIMLGQTLSTAGHLWEVQQEARLCAEMFPAGSDWAILQFSEQTVSKLYRPTASLTYVGNLFTQYTKHLQSKQFK